MEKKKKKKISYRDNKFCHYEINKILLILKICEHVDHALHRTRPIVNSTSLNVCLRVFLSFSLFPPRIRVAQSFISHQCEILIYVGSAVSGGRNANKNG